MAIRTTAAVAFTILCGYAIGCSRARLEPAAALAPAAAVRGQRAEASPTAATQQGSSVEGGDQPSANAQVSPTASECEPQSDDVCRFRTTIAQLADAPAQLPTELWTYLHPLAAEVGEMDPMPQTALEPKQWCGDAAKQEAATLLAGFGPVDDCHRAPLYCTRIGHHVETRIYARRGPGGDPIPWLVVTLASARSPRERAAQERDVTALLRRAERASCATPPPA
jgi:hypothetical protein